MVLLFSSLYFTKELHFTIALAGVVMSFYGMGSILGSYVGGWLTDRKNLHSIMLFSLISSSLVLFLLLIAKTSIFISCIIFAYAFLADLFRPASSKAIALYSSIDNRTRSVSLVRLAVNLGFSIGPAIGGLIALHIGYKWLFVIDALTGLAASVMLFYYLPKQEHDVMDRDASVLSNSNTSAYRDRFYLFFILLVALYGMSFFQFFASVPQYLSTVFKYNEDTIGYLLGLNGLLVVLIEMPLVAFLENKENTFRFIIYGALCLPVSLAILVAGNGVFTFALVYTLIITLSEIFAMPFMFNFTLTKSSKERQGQYSALYSISYGVANIAAPLVGLGIAGRYGFNTMFYFFIALSIATTIGFALLNKKVKKIR